MSFIEACDSSVENSADSNIINGCDAPALFYAILRGDLEIIKVLLQHGADPTLKASSGWVKYPNDNSCHLGVHYF